ncbi:hypothetical protein Taro_004352, partial [Colocasia esculenta]|nr:hypothetical protein [Colocasia esculenta]
SEVAVPVVRRSFSHGCAVSLVVTPSCSFPTSWRWDVGSCIVRLGSHVVALVASFPAGCKCEQQKSVAAVAECACYERGCWFDRAAVGFVVGLHVSVGVSQRLREPTCGVAFTSAGLWPVDPVEGRDSLSQEFITGRWWWRFVAPHVASSLFQFIAYLTRLNSNPSGSSDPWVAARPSGSLEGV